MPDKKEFSLNRLIEALIETEPEPENVFMGLPAPSPMGSEIAAGFTPGLGDLMDIDAASTEFANAIENFKNYKDAEAFDNLGWGGLATLSALAGPLLSIGAIKAVKDLPMDEASRLARAKKLGFQIPDYGQFNVPDAYLHGSPYDIKEFTSTPIWLTEPYDADVADMYRQRKAFEDLDIEWPEYANSIDDFHPDDMKQLAKEENRLNELNRGSLYPLTHRAKNVLDLTDIDSNVNDLDNIITKLIEHKIIKDKEIDADWINEIRADYEGKSFFRFLEEEGFIPEIKKAGYDAIKINDVSPVGREHISLGILDPRKVRSIFAKFDPANINSSDLLASTAGLGLASALINPEGE